MRAVILIACASLLASCDGTIRAANSALSSHTATTPIATASDSGSARFTLVLCDRGRGTSGEVIATLIDDLVARSPLVSATGAANASVMINLCGGPTALALAAAKKQ